MAYDTINLDNNNLVINNLDNTEDNDIDNDILNNFILYFRLYELKQSIHKNMEYIYNNPFILYIFVLFFNIFDQLLDYLIISKDYMNTTYKKYKKILVKDNYVTGIFLIGNNHFTELKNTYFQIKEIDKNIFEKIFNESNYEINNDSCILIKYIYQENKYRLYLNYENINENVYKLPLEIENMNDNINNKYSKDDLHSFKNECDDIEYAKINNIDILNIINECNGPFNDFGLLLNNKIYVKYLMKELNIDKLENLDIKYKNFHLDEDEMELKDHKIFIENQNKYIISDIIGKKLK